MQKITRGAIGMSVDRKFAVARRPMSSREIAPNPKIKQRVRQLDPWRNVCAMILREHQLDLTTGKKMLANNVRMVWKKIEIVGVVERFDYWSFLGPLAPKIAGWQRPRTDCCARSTTCLMGTNLIPVERDVPWRGAHVKTNPSAAMTSNHLCACHPLAKRMRFEPLRMPTRSDDGKKLLKTNKRKM